MLAVSLLAIASCSDEEVVGGCDPCPPQFQDLWSRETVLGNLELAYSRRNISRYSELLDDNFTFFLSAGDVNGGLPPAWGRLDDLIITTRLLDPNYAGANRVKSIAMDLQIENGVMWNSFNPPSAPDETWYTASVSYHFVFDIEPDTQLRSGPASEATFTVRRVSDNPERWRLVEMRDLGVDGALVARTYLGGTEIVTWGGIKLLYR
jgi:hypothetical protein